MTLRNQLDLIENKDTLIFKKGQIIYFEGSSPQGIYLIEQGKVKVTKTSCSGKDFITHIASKGDILSYGDLSLDTRHSCSGIAMEETIIYFIYKRDFQEALHNHPELLEGFFQQLVNHIRELESKACSIAYKPVRGRLAEALLYLAKKFNNSNKVTLSVTITRKDLAELIGTARETVNRLLSEFRHDRYIKTEGLTIHIINTKALQKTSEMYG
ncbi:Crp/Fnr family transcriptional regulator [Mangrovimonas spongiae]|nr:Crp/Fnr family transcriptional regulator [Mangrovimonas spongiae]